MNQPHKHRILVVDDDPAIREMMTALLASEGYSVATADDGFDALLQLTVKAVDIIISDLNMPHMSGFELLSVVRRRFPEIPVIAISGAYDSGENVPGGVIADAFYPKGRHRPEELLCAIADLIQTTGTRNNPRNRKSAPVWIPRNGRDSNGVPFVVVTCTQCLRSFPLTVPRDDLHEIQETPCLFCTSPVRYIIDFSVDVFSPGQEPVTSKGHSAGK